MTMLRDAVTLHVSFSMILLRVLLSSRTLHAEEIEYAVDNRFQRYGSEHYGIPQSSVTRISTEFVSSQIHCASICSSVLLDNCKTFVFNKKSGACAVSSDYVHAIRGGVTLYNTSGSQIFSSGVSPCIPNYVLNPLSKTCVGLHIGNLGWSDSKAHCEALGEHLLTLQTIEDAEWFQQMTETEPDWYHNAWIGGYRSGGNWQWMGRVTETIAYEFWDSRDQYSDADCIVIWGRGWRFGEHWCPETNNIIEHYCEADLMV